MTTLPANYAVQQTAKRVLAEIAPSINSDSTERSIASFAADRLATYGCVDTWYYDCPALVLLGSRSCLSESGRSYQPADEIVGLENLITVDLSPCLDGIWGDCARSYVVERGRVTQFPLDANFRRGLEFQARLHARMLDFVTPDTTFRELCEFANLRIAEAGFESLDFLGNLGHSIAARLSDRIYVAAANQATLASVPCFTFEPHVRYRRGRWGFKLDNIYYFDSRGIAVEL